jgi:hypothetical protein
MGLLEFLLGIGGNLLSAAVGFGIGWLWRSTQRTLRTRLARRFWRPFLSGEPRIVIGRFLEFAAFEPTGLVGAGSANALAELRTYLSDLGR